MKRNESRFFLNWQLPKDDARALHECSSDKERTQLIEKWISWSSGLISAAAVDEESHWQVIINFFEGHLDCARKAKFTQVKMSCLLEIMLYLMKQLLTQRLTEDKSYEIFKELLLRHSV